MSEARARVTDAGRRQDWDDVLSDADCLYAMADSERRQRMAALLRRIADRLESATTRQRQRKT